MWKRISLILFIALFIGISLYAIWVTRWLQGERINLAQLVDQLKTERKTMFLRDAGLSLTTESDFYQVAREIRNKLYQNNWTIQQPETFTGKYGDVHTKYNFILGNRQSFSCGDASQVYRWALASFNIPSRIVQLAAQSFVSGEKAADTHVFVEVFDGKKWFISDVTFNVEYYCSDGSGPLSTKELKKCVEKGQEIIPKYGKVIIPNRTVETYYLPLKDLLYAYTLWPTNIGNKTIPIEEHPFPGWIKKASSQYNKN